MNMQANMIPASMAGLVLASGLDLGKDSGDWPFWIDILIKVIMAIIAAIAAKKASKPQENQK
jgi:hypothetical protein